MFVLRDSTTLLLAQMSLRLQTTFKARIVFQVVCLFILMSTLVLVASPVPLPIVCGRRRRRRRRRRHHHHHHAEAVPNVFLVCFLGVVGVQRPAARDASVSVPGALS